MSKRNMKNVTPSENETLVKTDRVKVVILTNGDNVIADVQEATHKDTGERQAFILNFPYKVEYDQPKLNDTGIVTDPEVKVHYSPYCPLTTEVRIPINPGVVTTILEPVPSLRDTYIANVQKMGGSVE